MKRYQIVSFCLLVLFAVGACVPSSGNIIPVKSSMNRQNPNLNNRQQIRQYPPQQSQYPGYQYNNNQLSDTGYYNREGTKSYLTPIPKDDQSTSLDNRYIKNSDNTTAIGRDESYAPTSQRQVRVGMLLPLSGEAKEVGEALKNAALLAQFEMNSDNLIVQFYDTEGTPAGASQAVSTAISQGVSLILGPLFSDSAQAITPQIEAAGIQAISFTTDPRAPGGNLYSLGLMLSQQVEQIMSFAYVNGYRRFAVVAPDDISGGSVMQAALRTADLIGAEVTKSGYYDPKASDFTGVIKKITDYEERHKALEEEKEKLENMEDEASVRALKKLEELDTLGEPEFDAIIIAEEGNKLRSIVALLSYYDVPPTKVKYLGTTLWRNKNLVKEKLLHSGWFPAPPSTEHEIFNKKFKDNFGYAPPEIASLAFDAVALAAVLSQSNNFSRQALLSPAGFAGIDGIFRFRKDGTAERGLSIMEIKPENIVEIVSAPDEFDTSSPFNSYYSGIEGDTMPYQSYSGSTTEYQNNNPTYRPNSEYYNNNYYSGQEYTPPVDNNSGGYNSGNKYFQYR